MYKDTNVVFLKCNIDEEGFQKVTKKLKDFNKKLDLTIFVNNKEVYTEKSLEYWLSLRDLIEDKKDDIMPEKVIIMYVKGFRPEDYSKVEKTIGDALIDWNINVLLVSDPIKPVTMEEFFEKVELDLKIRQDVINKKKTVKHKKSTRKKSTRRKR